jgi:hypothetical protein
MIAREKSLVLASWASHSSQISAGNADYKHKSDYKQNSECILYPRFRVADLVSKASHVLQGPVPVLEVALPLPCVIISVLVQVIALAVTRPSMKSLKNLPRRLSHSARPDVSIVPLSRVCGRGAMGAYACAVSMAAAAQWAGRLCVFQA